MRKISILSWGIILLAFTGCSSEESGLQEKDLSPITLVSSVAQTRSANVNLQKTQIANGVKVGVFVQNADGFIANGNNAQMTADGNGGLNGTLLYYPADGSAVSIHAYAPYSTAFSDMADNAVPFTVASDQSTDAGYLASDLLCGAPVGTNAFTKGSPTVPLNFMHKLSKVNVKFKTGGTTDVDLRGATINIVNTLPSTTLKVSDGTVGEASGTATTIKAVTFAANATEFLASAVIVPQKVAAGSFVQVALTNGKVLNAQLNTASTFLSGKSYTYSVNISGQGGDATAIIEMASTVTDWDANTDELTGDVTVEDGGTPGGDPPTPGDDTPDTPAESGNLYATFRTPGGNASYAAPTYTWTATTNNLMTCFEFANGELANYKELKFTISNLSGNMVRMGYYVGSIFTEFGNGFGSNGTKTVDLTALGIDLSTVTRISFGGRTGTGTVDIKVSDVYLVPKEGSTGGGSTTSSLTATFGTPGGNASYAAPTYTWTATTNNLMTCFEFANGELAGYKTLTFKFSNLTGGMVRMGYYVGSAFTEFGNGYGSNGTKTVDLTALGIDLKTVTKISFGGRTGTGSVDIKASDVILSN